MLDIFKSLSPWLFTGILFAGCGETAEPKQADTATLGTQQARVVCHPSDTNPPGTIGPCGNGLCVDTGLCECEPGWILAANGTCTEPDPEAPVEVPEAHEDLESGSLKHFKLRDIPGLEMYVKDKEAAILLGKALFWDMQAGSDGQTACASCHFKAGADGRIKNNLNPGNANTMGPPTSITWGLTATGTNGPNVTMAAADFPFRMLSDTEDRKSSPTFDTDDVMGSQGVFRRDFVSVTPGAAVDSCTPVPDPIFSVANKTGGQSNVRLTTGRNTPTVINASFNDRNFWDGRANNVFNGVDPFGRRNPNAVIHVWDGSGVVQEQVHLKNASMASQAVGPPVSAVEMSCAGRTFGDIGTKMVSAVPLKLQKVHATDSVLGPHVRGSGKGLEGQYAKYIRAAFKAKYHKEGAWSWDGKPLIESNFSLFWGLSVMLYEQTLISDDSPFDRFKEGNEEALSRKARRGMNLFDSGMASCSGCHEGPTQTGAHRFKGHKGEQLVERMPMGNHKPALYDNAFYNIGVRATKEDIGTGGLDPWGNPLSLSRLAKQKAGGIASPDELSIDSCLFEESPCVDVDKNERDAVDGSFKTPTLRNIGLTGPYFHNGGQATLIDVVRFYNRGGDMQGEREGSNTTGFGPNDSNLDPDIESLDLDEEDMDNLVAFMESLTDERVRWERAPFDHPQLMVAHGHKGDHLMVFDKGNGEAETDFFEVPAVGAAGRGAEGLGPIGAFICDMDPEHAECQPLDCGYGTLDPAGYCVCDDDYRKDDDGACTVDEKEFCVNGRLISDDKGEEECACFGGTFLDDYGRCTLDRQAACEHGQPDSEGECQCWGDWVLDEDGRCTVSRQEACGNGRPNAMGKCECWGDWFKDEHGKCSVSGQEQCGNGRPDKHGVCACFGGWTADEYGKCSVSMQDACANGQLDTYGSCQCYGDWFQDDHGKCTVSRQEKCANGTPDSDGMCQCWEPWCKDGDGRCTLMCGAD